MRALALALVLALAGCDELVGPVEHEAYPTSRHAAEAVCAQQCRWARACLADDLPVGELTACNATCSAFLSADAPEVEPVGTDDQIDACVHDLWTYTQAAGACYLAAPPRLSACLDVARPNRQP